MLSQTRKLEITTTSNESEALLLEANLIKKFKPKFNILLRDDKSFPFIFIGNHDKKSCSCTVSFVFSSVCVAAILFGSSRQTKKKKSTYSSTYAVFVSITTVNRQVHMQL